MASNWRILIIEDDENISSQVVADAVSGKLLPDVGEMHAEACQKFSEALPCLESMRFDFLILDLGEDREAVSREDASGGLNIFEEIKKRRFVPVIFYTALAHRVRNLESAFVRVVEKTEGLIKLREQIQSVFKTGLPDLLRHLEEEQRKYMWDFIENTWQNFKSSYEKADLTYLLARRLAHSLRQCSIRQFLKSHGVPTPGPEEAHKVHPIEMYIKPVTESDIFTGYILKGRINGHNGHWIVLTPSCDFEHARAERVLLAKCLDLTEQTEYRAYDEKRDSNSKGDLKSLLKDNRQGKQRERFKYLPGTFFIPDLVVDFQHLIQISRAQLDSIEKVAALDSPFTEAILAQFSHYYGRVGTPNLDIELILVRIESSLTNIQQKST